jgi:hypothetical protein
LFYEELLSQNVSWRLVVYHKMTYGNLREAISRSQVQACVALVLEIWIAKLVGVVPNDTPHQRKVVEQDSTP